MRTDRVAAWTVVLDDLEDALTETERSLASGEPRPYADWRPPVDLGPIPRELAGRAGALVERQERTLLEGGLALGAAREALTVSRRARGAMLRSPQRPATSVYLDTTA